MSAARAITRRLLGSYGGWPIHVALAVLLLPRAVFLGEALFDRDLHVDWYPRVLVFAQTMRWGLLPLWDLSIGFGQPLLADPGAQVLYPTTWLALILAPWTLYTVYAVVHLVFSGVGFTRLARTVGLSRGEAIAAGAAWMLSGPFVSLVNLWHHLAGAAWTPWVVLAAHRLVRRPTPGRTLLFAAPLGLQVLAGSGDMVLITASLVGVWLLATGPHPRRAARALLPLAAGILLAAALSAGQWLPTVELASRAMRRELPEEYRVEWSVPPAGLVRTVVPLDASGRVAYTQAAQVALFGSRRHPFFGSLYFGVAALALGGVALACGRRRRASFMLGAGAALALLISLGSHAPFHGLAVRLVPGAAHFRYPTKVTVAAAFAVAMLAGLGLRAVRAPGRRALGKGLAFGGALWLGGTAALFGPALPQAIDWGFLLDRQAVEGDALPSLVRLADHAVLALLTGLALLRAGPAVPWPRFLAAGCLIADLLLAHHDLHATAPSALLNVAPPVLRAVDRTGRGRAYVYEYEILHGTSERLLGRPLPYVVAQPLPGTDPRPLAALGMRVYPVPPGGGFWGLEGSYDLDIRGLQPLALHELNLLLRRVEGTSAHPRLLRLGAVRTVVALHEQGFEDLVPGPSFTSLFGEPIRTYSVPDSLPRVYAVGRPRAVEDREALAILLDPSFDPTREAVLSGPGAEEAASVATGQGGPSPVRLVQLFADRVRLEVERDAPGVVVSVDAWDPGWKGFVDDRPAPVVRANGAFRAIAVPAGRHVVEMVYRPTAALVGLALSGTSLVLGVALAVALRLRSRGR